MYQAGKTLWDWLELLIVPVLIAGFGLLILVSGKIVILQNADLV